MDNFKDKIAQDKYVKLRNGNVMRVVGVDFINNDEFSYPCRLRLHDTCIIDNKKINLDSFVNSRENITQFTKNGNYLSDESENNHDIIDIFDKCLLTVINNIPDIGDFILTNPLAGTTRSFLVREIEWTTNLEGQHLTVYCREKLANGLGKLQTILINPLNGQHSEGQGRISYISASTGTECYFTPPMPTTFGDM